MDRSCALPITDALRKKFVENSLNKRAFPTVGVKGLDPKGGHGALLFFGDKPSDDHSPNRAVIV